MVSQRAEQSQCKKCTVNKTHKNGTDKKDVASRADRTGLKLGGWQAAEMADEFGRVDGRVELLFIDGAECDFAMVLPAAAAVVVVVLPGETEQGLC